MSTDIQVPDSESSGSKRSELFGYLMVETETQNFAPSQSLSRYHRANNSSSQTLKLNHYPPPPPALFLIVPA